MVTKYTKGPHNEPNQNISNGQKIFQITTKCTNGSKILDVAIKFTNISNPRSSKMSKNWDFWYENIPSGNPASS
jgi:hypothetical protein